MIEPTGPLPASVYWRRRTAAIAAAVAALLLVVWLVGALFSSDDDPATHPAAAVATASTPPSSAEFELTSPTQSSTTAPPATATTPPAPPPPPPPPPGPPQACPDDVIGVTAVPAAPSFAVGTQMGLSMTIANTGQVPCIRDIGRHLRELAVMTADGRVQLWSSNHCLATTGEEVRILQPGEKFDFGTKWVGSTSEPGCGKFTRLGPGDYLLVAKLGPRASNPVPFRIT